jgi:hypothetical protein
MKTPNEPIKITGTNPTHKAQERSPFLREIILVVSAETKSKSKKIIKIYPTAAPVFSLLAALSITGRITVAKIPSIGTVNIVPKPRPIAHQAVFVFGFPLNLLNTSFSTLILYHFSLLQ